MFSKDLFCRHVKARACMGKGYDDNFVIAARTLPPRTHGIPPPPSVSPQVQATYSFSSNVDSQLNFIEGDIITLLGEKSEGWQYGENSRTQM